MGRPNLSNDYFQSRIPLSDNGTEYSEDTMNFDEISLIKDITNAIQSTYHKLMTQAQICNFLIQSKSQYFTRRYESQWKLKVKRILETNFCAESYCSSYHKLCSNLCEKHIEIVWKVSSTSTDDYDFLCLE